MRNNAWMLLAVVSLACSPLVGCDGGGGATTAAPAPKKAAKVPDLAPPVIEEEDTGPVYSYNPIGKRDPFRSFIQRDLVVNEIGGPVGPLQMHELDNYQLRGIVWNTAAPRALVEAPDGIGHVVELGTLIGKNWGKVTQIKPEEIVITEEFRDPIENELIINEITVRLPKPGRDKK